MSRDLPEAQEIDRLRAHVAKVSEVSRHIAERRDLETVLQEVVDAVRSLTVARYGAAGVFDESGQVRDSSHQVPLWKRSQIWCTAQGTGGP